MRRLTLGTAGHIDHGKTALVKALTGVDTDRLKEEKERGITVDLGFAELRPGEDLRFGIVDVPGHEGFIRNMLAGATGLDIVLLVVAADEGVMPQTREHLSIVQLLGVPRMVVAVTKADLVEEDWLELVMEEVSELLLNTPYADAPVVPVSAVSGRGLDQLTGVLADLGAQAEGRGGDDVARLPIDRVFTVKGAGTVVTGTLWSGRLRVGEHCRVLPGSRTARIRSLQIHGEEVEEALAGGRVAVGLSGSGIGAKEVRRGQSLVIEDGWEASWMLTCRLSLLEGTGWQLQQGQRVRVHLGTAEVMARAMVLEEDRIAEGGEGWVQLRLEAALLARVRDHLVIRSYSPLTTMGGGRVAEVLPGKRRTLSGEEKSLLGERLSDSTDEAVASLLRTAGWNGVAPAELPQRTGWPPALLATVVTRLLDEGRAVRAEERLFADQIWRSGREKIFSSLEVYHRQQPLRPGMPLEELRQVLPGEQRQRLSDALIKEMDEEGRLRTFGGLAALTGFRPSLTPTQEALRERLRRILDDAGLAAPTTRELADEIGDGSELEGVLRFMEAEGELVALESDLFVPRAAVLAAGQEVVDALAGATELGPADFRDVLPLTRKHLLPLLRFFDTVGITTRIGQHRTVALSSPPDW